MYVYVLELVFRYNEWMVGTLFVILVLLWFFRSPGFMEGWGDQFKPG